MKTTINLNSYPELIIQKAIQKGIANNKTAAITIGLLDLNDKYKLVDNEIQLVAKKLEKLDKEAKIKGTKFVSLDKAMKKYSHLK